ncbi:MAG: holo-ACP synthase [Parachlamydia sp.]|jgi:holo-[acyl-carrier protein] synthase|nr:holo-ACP synthase [Parachlamydia sp.]
MVLGIGTDIIEIDRLQASIDKYGQRFLDRVFTPDEQCYCLRKKKPALHFAGRFAAKEAIVKSLGTGFSGGLTWLDIEIVNDSLGKPIVKLSTIADERFDSPSILISLSHSRDYATAFALYQK